MTSVRFEISFDGYWPFQNWPGMPAAPGVFCVYGGRHNWAPPTFSLVELLYIGDGINIREEVLTQMVDYDFRTQYDDVYLNAAVIESPENRKRILSALIHQHKPICNSNEKNIFSFDRTVIVSRGKNALLIPQFEITKSANSSSKCWG